MPTSTPLPAGTAPLWTDIAGVWISAAGAVASTIVAVVALIVSIAVMRVQRGDAARQERANWASDMQVWLDESKVHMLLEDAATVDPDWVNRGNVLMARAGVLSSPGAESLMIAAKTARTAMRELTPEQRRRSVHSSTALLKAWVRDWVNDPREFDPPVAEWVRDFAKLPDNPE